MKKKVPTLPLTQGKINFSFRYVPHLHEGMTMGSWQMNGAILAGDFSYF